MAEANAACGDGDIVILAGGTGRVGGATLATLVARDAQVVVFSRDATARFDLTRFSEAESAVRRVYERFGRIDGVISLAGGGC